MILLDTASVQVPSDGANDLEDFLKLQSTTQEATAEQLMALSNDIHRLVRQACDLTIDEFLQVMLGA